MPQRPGTSVCPKEPFLEKKGLKGRKLAALENGLVYGQENYKWFLNVNAVIISCKKEITPDNVRVALRKLCERHPTLRMRVTPGENKDKYLTFFDSDPEPNLETLDTDDYIGTCEAEFFNNFKEGELQWRVKMLRATKDPVSERLRYPFVFIYNHAIVDGGSIMAGININFHRYLEDAVCGKDNVVESLDLLPGRETMFPDMEVTMFDKVMFKLKELFKGPLLADDPMAAELLKAIQPEQEQQVRCTKMLPMDFTVEETGKMIQKCKENGIKVNGYATAAAAIATGNLFRNYTKNPELKNELTLDLSFMLNIRRFCNPPISPEQTAILNTIQSMPITVADDGNDRVAFWELAKKCHHDVHALIKGDAVTESAKMLNYLFLDKQDTFFKYYAEIETPHSLYYMTNRGNFEVKSQYPDDEGSCEFEANYWACGEHEMNFDIFVQNLQSVNGHLMWTLAYYGHKCSDEIAREYLDNIRGILLRMSD